MIRAKNYEAASKFVKVMPRILWPLFYRIRCISTLFIVIAAIVSRPVNKNVNTGAVITAKPFSDLSGRS